MRSYAYGKDEVCDWVRVRFPIGATAPDVGACDGNWRRADCRRCLGCSAAAGRRKGPLRPAIPVR